MDYTATPTIGPFSWDRLIYIYDNLLFPIIYYRNIRTLSCLSFFCYMLTIALLSRSWLQIDKPVSDSDHLGISIVSCHYRLQTRVDCQSTYTHIHIPIHKAWSQHYKAWSQISIPNPWYMTRISWDIEHKLKMDSPMVLSCCHFSEIIIFN